MKSSSTCPDRRAIAAAAGAVLLAILLCALLPARAAALDPERALSQYIRDRWTSENGFPGGAVAAITQTTDGYLWIAAEKGLVRFDGVTFRLFEPSGPSAAGGPAVLGLAADPDGSLWLRLRGPSLLRFRDGTFEPISAGADVPGSVVTAMAHAHDGALLLATLGRGPMAYRGGRFEPLVGSGGLESSFVLALAESARGDLWLGTRDAGLFRLRDRQAMPIAGLPDQKVNSIQPGDGETVWIGTDAGVVRWNGVAVTREGVPAPLAAVRALAMTRDRDANVWMATAAHGLLRVNARGAAALPPRNTRPGAAPLAVTTVFEDREGNIWLGDPRGIERLRDGVFTTYTTAQGLPSDSAGPIFADAEGRIWFAPAEGGLSLLRDGTVTRVTAGGLADDVIYSIAGDADSGDVWVGRQRGGLTRLRLEGDRMTADSFTQADGLAQNSVYAVHVARDGAVWAGTLSGGVSRLAHGRFTTFTVADGLASNTVAALLEDRGGTLWLATPNGLSANGVTANGLSARPASRWQRYTTSDGLPSNDVNTLFEDAAGRLWIGTAAGLAWMDGGRVRALPKHAVAAASAGGSGGAAAAAAAGSARTAGTADAADVSGVGEIAGAGDTGGTGGAADTRGTGDMGGNGGVPGSGASPQPSAARAPRDLSSWSARLRDLLPAQLDPPGVPGAASNAGASAVARLRAPILGIAEDRSGWLWIATADRVLRVRRDWRALDPRAAAARSAGASARRESETISNDERTSDSDAASLRDYGLADGLMGLEGVKRHRSVIRDARGRIWLSMSHGLSVVDPAQARGGLLPALAHVDEVSADGVARAPAGTVPIAARPQRITFTYTGLSLAMPERVRFRYRLDGFDRGWSEPVTARQAVYTNLGPGTYRFRVQASNSDGLWTGPEAAVQMAIAPAFWQTIGFRLSALLLCAAIGWAAYRVRVHQVASVLNVRFEERLAERTRIAQELHDTLLQGFLSASMQLHVAADRLPDDSPAKPALTRVQALMRRVIDEGRNAVRGLRSTGADALDLEQAFSGVPQELALDASGAPIGYRVIVQGTPRPLNPIIRDEVYRIGREALVNAFRHAAARSIEVELEYGAARLRVLVRDDGRGIDPQVLRAGSDGHWGLSGMRERADRIGARFKVWSRALAGTEVELSVPGHVAFQRSEREGES